MYQTRIPTRLFILALALLSIEFCHGQFPSTVNSPYLKTYKDSLKAMDYQGKLPFLGKKAYKKGFDIPYPVGVMVNYYSQSQQILIDKVEVGIDDNALYDVSGLITFGPIEATTNTVTFRPDVWVLPFLNVYGVFGYGTTKTDVELIKPFNFKTTQEFSGTSKGVGVTVAGAVGPVVVIVDQNYNWADLESFTEPVPAYNLGIRVGHNFVNERRPDKNVVVWVGPFYQNIKSDTDGKIALSDVFDGMDLNERISNNEELQEWYGDLGPIQRATVDKVVEKVSDYLTDLKDSELHYRIDKRAKQEWNLIFGAQYQFNKRWQLRSETGVYGSRSQFLLSLNYRFVL